MSDTQDRVNILLVDDNDEKLIALDAVLEELQQNVVKVRSGREALRCLLSQEFAVILLDVNMPGLNGFETAELIRQRKATENTPIIFITAYGDEVFVERGYSLGAVDYILTPVVPEVLRSKVSVFVELHRQTEQIRRQAASLRQRAAQLGALANQLTQVEQRERRRLAQVLHDHLQQLLVAAKMRISTAEGLTREKGVTEALRHVDQLVSDAIGVSRTLTVELSPPILHDGGLVRALEWLARRMGEDHGLVVKVEAKGGEPEDLPEPLRVLLFEAVRELLFNIVKHAGVLEASVTLTTEKDRTVRMTVRDGGVGFDAAAIYQKGATDRFGLFSIRERLTLLNGGVELTTAPGKGTAITLTAPLSAASDHGSSTAPVAAPALRLVGREAESDASADNADGPRVLLADDHEVLRKGLASLLSGQGVRIVAEASDGEEAVSLALEHRPDVVVLDVSMPRLNGIEAARQISAAAPEVRIIGLSMHDSAEMAAAMRSAGAVAYLNKAGPPEQLLDAILAARAMSPEALNQA